MAGRMRVRRAACFAALAAGLLGVFLLNVGLGPVPLSLGEILRALFGGAEPGENAWLIVWRVRLPRAAAGLAGGAALGSAGLLLQAFFANPIVEPYVLGVSSGASLFVALVTLGGFTFGLSRVTPLFLFAGAFAGAMVVMLAVLFAASRVKSAATLLIVGLMAGYVCSAATSILSAFAQREQIANYTLWTMGSFSGFTWAQTGILGAVTAVMFLCSLALAKPLNALALGDRYAGSMGISVRGTRLAIILISGVLTAAVTAFAGPVSFIGLAVPHICRILLRTSDSRLLLPAVALGGGLMASACDLAARMAVAPAELPLGAVTSLIGAPVVVYLLARREKL